MPFFVNPSFPINYEYKSSFYSFVISTKHEICIATYQNIQRLWWALYFSICFQNGKFVLNSARNEKIIDPNCPIAT
jgi:hypothetical protein